MLTCYILLALSSVLYKVKERMNIVHLQCKHSLSYIEYEICFFCN